MDPYDEQRLREEVIYLHSLWHQGPPRSTSTNSSNDPLHQLSNRNKFKKKWANPRAQKESRRSRDRTNRNQEGSSTQPIQDSGKEWPCNPTSNYTASASKWPTVTAQSNPQSFWPSAASGKEWPCDPSSDTAAPTSGWPTITARDNSQTSLLYPEQQARFAANQAQFKAVKATKEFFRRFNNSDDDEIADDDDDDLGDDGESDKDEDDDFTEEEYGAEEYRFFVQVFEEDGELRDYYEKNYQNGDFSCLVCCGVGIKKASKRFKDCVALIQHSVSIARTKKRRAHRAYGKAICKVLGWDIDKLPTIVSAMTENLGVSLSNSGANEGEAQGYVGVEPKDNSDVHGNTEAPVDIGSGGELQEKESTSNEPLPSNVESIVSENSLIVADTSKCGEDPSLTAPKIVEDKESEQRSDVDNSDGPGNTEAPVDIGNGGELQEKESTSNEPLPSNVESIVSENSLIAADTSRCDEDPSFTAPKIVEDKESEQRSDVEIPNEDKIAEDEEAEAAPDDHLKNNGGGRQGTYNCV